LNVWGEVEPSIHDAHNVHGAHDGYHDKPLCIMQHTYLLLLNTLL